MWLFLLGVSTVVKEKESMEAQNLQCEILPSNQELYNKAKVFYESYGVWSGVFQISNEKRTRIVKVKPNMIEYHLHYEYVAIPNNRLQRQDSGEDQRVFSLRCEKGWEVLSMGTYMSAKMLP